MVECKNVQWEFVITTHHGLVIVVVMQIAKRYLNEVSILLIVMTMASIIARETVHVVKDACHDF